MPMMTKEQEGTLFDRFCKENEIVLHRERFACYVIAKQIQGDEITHESLVKWWKDYLDVISRREKEERRGDTVWE